MIDAIIDSDVLSDALRAVGTLVDECKIEIREDGLYIELIDPSTVAAAQVQLEASAFESYNGSGGLIGVDITRFQDILKMVNSGTLINLESDLETRRLELTADNLQCKLSLIDPDLIRSRPNLDHVDLPASAVIEGSHLSQAIKSADMVSSHMEIGVNEQKEYFYVEADGDQDEIQYKLPEKDLINFQKASVSSVFSVDYFTDVLKAVPSNAEVTVNLGEEMPSELHFQFAEGSGRISYYLAPRLRNQ